LIYYSPIHLNLDLLTYLNIFILNKLLNMLVGYIKLSKKSNSYLKNKLITGRRSNLNLKKI